MEFIERAQGMNVKLWPVHHGRILLASALSLLLLGHLSEAAAANRDDWVPGAQAFELASGRGVPVCDAYLTMLRSLQFERPPFCSRAPLTQGHGSGFEPLGWRKLPFELEYDLTRVAPPYFQTGRPDALQKGWAERDRIEALRVPEAASRISHRERVLAGIRASVERSQRNELSLNGPYELGPPMDINNDGQADRLVILPTDTCGAVRLHYPEARPSHAAVLDPAGRFDFRITDEVFRDAAAYRTGGSGQAAANSVALPMPRYLVGSVSITRYAGAYFFDGVRVATPTARRAGTATKALLTISVFEHREGVTHLRCEVNWLGPSSRGQTRR